MSMMTMKLKEHSRMKKMMKSSKIFANRTIPSASALKGRSKKNCKSRCLANS